MILFTRNHINQSITSDYLSFTEIFLEMSVRSANQWRTVGQRIGGGGGGGGAPSGKVCVVTSVASFLVWGGGGGKTPKCTDKKCTYTARARETSERLRNIYFQDSKYICLHIKSMHFPLLMVWRYKRYYTDKTLNLRKKSMNMRASLENFHIFTC